VTARPGTYTRQAPKRRGYKPDTRKNALAFKGESTGAAIDTLDVPQRQMERTWRIVRYNWRDPVRVVMIRPDRAHRRAAEASRLSRRTPGTVSSAHATVKGRSVPGERHKQ